MSSPFPSDRLIARRLLCAVVAGAASLVVACAGPGESPSAAADPAVSGPRELRVCSDPNNLPFSNERGEGFENRLATIVAEEMDATVHYTWWAQRRGFIRNTLRALDCDVVMGVPTTYELVLATRPYYRSTYVFLYRSDRDIEVRTLDDEILKTSRVGVHVIGDDYANPPPAHALANRGVVRNVVGYSIFGDYSQPNPPARLVEAVAADEIDVAVLWGPFGGYFGARQAVPMEVVPVSPEIDLPFLPMAFDISMGVRRGDEALRDELNDILQRRKHDIDALLAEFLVPTRQPRQLMAKGPA